MITTTFITLTLPTNLLEWIILSFHRTHLNICCDSLPLMDLFFWLLLEKRDNVQLASGLWFHILNHQTPSFPSLCCKLQRKKWNKNDNKYLHRTCLCLPKRSSHALEDHQMIALPHHLSITKFTWLLLSFAIKDGLGRVGSIRKSWFRRVAVHYWF